jgi:hypothetical protein
VVVVTVVVVLLTVVVVELTLVVVVDTVVVVVVLIVVVVEVTVVEVTVVDVTVVVVVVVVPVVVVVVEIQHVSRSMPEAAHMMPSHNAFSVVTSYQATPIRAMNTCSASYWTTPTPSLSQVSSMRFKKQARQNHHR